MEQKFSVSGMMCAACVSHVEKATKKLPGVTECNVSLLTSSMLVTFDEEKTNEKEIIKAVKKAGYKAAVTEDTAAVSTDKQKNLLKRRLILSVAFTIMLMYVSMGHMLGAPLPHVISPHGNAVLYILTQLILTLPVIILNRKYFIGGFYSLFHGTPNMESLIAIGSGAAFFYGVYVFVAAVIASANNDLAALTAYAETLYFESSAMILTLVLLGKTLEAFAKGKTTSRLEKLILLRPKTATRITVCGEGTVDVSLLNIGDILAVKSGESVPADGIVVKGSASVDASAITGESLPVELKENATVIGGTVCAHGYFEMKVTKTEKESLLSEIIRLVGNASASKAPIARLADKVSGIFVPAVICVFFITFFAWLISGADFSFAFNCAVSVLVISCPCALVISTPVTVVSALATATRCGLLIKGGLYLEEARKLVNIGLDKTGTLTKGEPAVAGVKYLATFDERLTGAMAASLAAMNKHPLSQAIARWAHERHLPVYQVEGFTAIPGAGVEGRIERGMVRLVNLRWLEEQGLADEEVRRTFAHYTNEGMSAVAVADAFGVQAVFGLADVVKEDTVEGLRQLASVGIRPWLLTGDNEAAARALAEKVGLKDVRADLLPEDKLKAIEELQKSGLTAMAGDGINDAPALARADIGIAMGVRGTDSAIEAAHIAVMDDRISSIATLVRLSRITHGLLVENIAFAIGVKIIFALLALTGNATMWMAVFADTGTCLIVVANAMRMLRMKPRLDRMAEEARRAA